MTAEVRRIRFPWGLTIVCALTFALLVWLGVWQVQRMQWKEGLIAQAEAVAKLPPVPLTTALTEKNPEFRRVTLDCYGLENAMAVEIHSIEEGRAGARVVSACPLPEGGAYDSIFVDRGFLDQTESRRLPGESAEMSHVVGVLRVLPADDPIRSLLFTNSVGEPLSWREPAMMSAMLDVKRPAPFTLYSLTSSNPDWLALQPSAPPAAFSNNHLGYALTWFGLALALVGFYIALLRRRLTP
jgi:surfeit locus 1 family protein